MVLDFEFEGLHVGRQGNLEIHHAARKRDVPGAIHTGNVEIEALANWRELSPSQEIQAGVEPDPGTFASLQGLAAHFVVEDSDEYVGFFTAVCGKQADPIDLEVDITGGLGRLCGERCRVRHSGGRQAKRQ